MSAHPQPHYTPEQYLAIERQAEFRSEYVNGQIFAMAGASLAHNRITRNIGQLLANLLQNSPCEVFLNDLRVRVSRERYTYPDAVVACGELELEDSSMDTLLNPKVIFEVASPSTAADDRGWKFEHYRRMPTLVDYVLVAQERPFVEHFSRYERDLWTLQEWRGLDATMRLPSLGCELALAQIYARVTFEPETFFPQETTPIPE